MKEITLALAAMLFILTSCGGSLTEGEAEEWQTKEQSPESLTVSEFVQDFNFSVQAYPMTRHCIRMRWS